MLQERIEPLYKGGSLRSAKLETLVAIVLAIGMTVILTRPALADRIMDPSAQSSARKPVLSRQGGVDILSDTRGVDFRPYLKGILESIRKRWITYIPMEGRPPVSAQAITLVRFTINPDGKVTDMHLDASNHKIAFDRAAWGASGNQNFPALPAVVKGPNLEIRVDFRVNTPPISEPDPEPDLSDEINPLK